MSESKLWVQKFGGTSVGSVERIQAVAKKIQQTLTQGYRLVVVVSAMTGETNRLVALGQQISQHPDQQAMDTVLSTGEQVTIGLLVIALAELGIQAQSLCGWQVPIKTDSSFSKARIESIDADHLHKLLAIYPVLVVAGFQGVDAEGRITTLGRGGSDTTAVALAAALKADECQIYTDVDGVYTTDPRVVPTARRLNKITFEEMLEMASLGSKVLQIRSVEFAGKYNVPLRVLSSFTEGPGTLITVDDEDQTMEQPVISGIAFSRDEAKIIVRGVPDVPGVAYKILGPVGEANVEVDMIVQNIGADQTTDFTFTVNQNDCHRVLEILKVTADSIGARTISGDTDVAKVSLVGVGMRSHAGIASQMFQVMAKENINIQMISTSEIKISIVIDQKYLELAVRALHSHFKLNLPAA
jgi:aspartate kinase